MRRLLPVLPLAIASVLWACGSASEDHAPVCLGEEQDAESWEAAMEVAGLLTPVLKELVASQPLDPTPPAESPDLDAETQLFMTSGGNHLIEVGLKTWGDPGLGGWLLALVDPVENVFFSMFLVEASFPEFSGPASLPESVIFPERTYGVEALYLLMEEANRRKEWDVEP